MWGRVTWQTHPSFFSTPLSLKSIPGRWNYTTTAAIQATPQQAAREVLHLLLTEKLLSCLLIVTFILLDIAVGPATPRFPSEAIP